VTTAVPAALPREREDAVCLGDPRSLAGDAEWPSRPAYRPARGGPLARTSCRPPSVRLFSRRSLRLAQGLDFHYRILHPALERFLQSDPSRQDGTLSYVYVGDDPLDGRDHSGLDPYLTGEGSALGCDNVTSLLFLALGGAAALSQGAVSAYQTVNGIPGQFVNSTLSIPPLTVPTAPGQFTTSIFNAPR